MIIIRIIKLPYFGIIRKERNKKRMLVNLSIRNFGPVGDEPFEFSMQTQLSTENANKDKEYAVPIDSTECPYVMTCAGIFGANASGKTTILNALRFIEYILDESHRFDREETLPDETFKFSDLKNENSEIQVVFTQNDYIYEYTVHCTSTEIATEILRQKSFGTGERWRIIIDRAKPHTYKDIEKFVNKNQSVISVWNNLDGVDKFDDVYDFFNKVNYIRGASLPTSFGTIHFNKYDKIIEMLNIADFGVECIELVKENTFSKDSIPENLKEIYAHAQKILKNEEIGENKSIDLPSSDSRIYKIFEDRIEEHSICFEMQADDTGQKHKFKLRNLSSGTKTFFAYASMLLSKLHDGGVLCIDELERSLHPFLTKHIIDLFCDTDINKRQAQLIFTSHDAVMLHKNILQPEQIYFTDKDKYSLQAELYSLAEFSLKNDRDFDYGKKYLQGVFGGVPTII